MALPSTLLTSGANQNSFISVSEASLYFERRLASDSWETASDDDKKKSLLMAYNRLLQERWDPDRSTWGSIPIAVKHSQCEIALVILENPKWFFDRGTEGWDRMTVGDEPFVPDHNYKAQELPEIVKRWLAPYLEIPNHFFIS